jgi:hypothetical protein
VKSASRQSGYLALFVFTVVLGGFSIYARHREEIHKKDEEKYKKQMEEENQKALGNLREGQQRADEGRTKAERQGEAQLQISTELTRELSAVRHELELAQRPVHHAVAHWRIANYNSDSCFLQYAQEASATRDAAGEKIQAEQEIKIQTPEQEIRIQTPEQETAEVGRISLSSLELSQLLGQRVYYEAAPNRLPLTDECKKRVVQDLWDIHIDLVLLTRSSRKADFLNTSFASALLNGEEVARAIQESGASPSGLWYFSVHGDPRSVSKVLLDPETKRISLLFDTVLGWEDLRTGDGAPVSTLEISGAGGFLMLHKVYGRTGRVPLLAVLGPSTVLTSLDFDINDRLITPRRTTFHTNFPGSWYKLEFGNF